ncbi:hypothetical protein JKI95_09525 [Corynebacterium aquatimens]|uniref:hypothetical protein n=1 Tax=Corynebacterium TaxID=1716 RepID=UPI001F2EF557|nr:MULTISPECIES: hypothetical protein [Corynebacterium]QYH19353.1 hypothetical protein JKI95_09525 [Corynebacterium aquatimens]UIZ91742.1 hypothetical protein JZY91_08380 [Corynebacterium sp. CNCTC7651]
MRGIAYTYAGFAEWLREDLQVNADPLFAVRALKKVVSAVRDIDSEVDFEQAHSCPASTGDDDWDRVIRAAAEMTYAERRPGGTRQWFEESVPPPDVWFYPTSRPSRFAFNLERTPAPFLDRRVCLGEGNLRSAKDLDRPWI